MGKTIEGILKARGHTIFIVDNIQELSKINPEEIEVAIEFSQPNAAFNNILYCLENNIKIVSGTTGWLENYENAKKNCLKNNGALFYASNYSIGVNIFFRLNTWLSKKMNEFPSYSTSIKEIHHTEKKDSPSGTAITLAENISENIDRLDGWTEGGNSASKIKIQSEREGTVPGTHIITYKSDIDTIYIGHEAHSRMGFALGAVLVAEWIIDKKGVLGMDDFLDI